MNEEPAAPDGDSVSLQIGDFVTWRGRLHVLRGIDPMGVHERRAEVEDCGTGARTRPPLEALVPAPDARSRPERFPSTEPGLH